MSLVATELGEAPVAVARQQQALTAPPRQLVDEAMPVRDAAT
ncbi:MAG TPA: hypothetical protein VG651_20345 [Stellaceae bacterium]|nr:hypothetical protein [Stellaceae bacterium]